MAPNPPVHIIRLSGWRGLAAIIVGLAVLAAMAAILALGFVFIVLPALLLMSATYYFLPRRQRPLQRKMGERDGGAVIDGTYRIAPEDDKGA